MLFDPYFAFFYNILACLAVPFYYVYECMAEMLMTIHDRRGNEPNEDSQTQPIESQQNDFSNMGAGIESDPEIHKDSILVIDNNDAHAQEECIPQPIYDEILQDHSQVGSGSMLETYLDQKSSEKPWKVGENCK